MACSSCLELISPEEFNKVDILPHRVHFLCANLTPLNDLASELVTSNLVTWEIKPAKKEANIQINVLLSDPLK